MHWAQRRRTRRGKRDARMSYESSQGNLLTLQEVATRIGRKSVQTVRKLIAEGELSYVKQGNHILVAPWQFDEYVNKNTVVR
jgi:excisionase family DNA binding protein